MHFGILQNLEGDMSKKNAAGYGPRLDLSTLKSLIFRGKEDINLQSADDNVNPVTVSTNSLYRAGSCTESGSGQSCTSSFVPYISPTPLKPLFEDSILACPFFGKQAFGTQKSLPIARSETWSYGTSAMIQKIRLMDKLDGVLIDNTSTTADNIDERVAALFRQGTTSLVGAYLMQKGSAIGGWDRVMILPAKSDWNETSLHCESSNTGNSGLSNVTLTGEVLTGGVEDLGRDFQYAYGKSLLDESYISAARQASIDSATINYENVTINHETLSWATVDLTEMVKNQLHWWYINTPTEPLELNFLWVPDYSSNHREFLRTHYPHQASGDPLGDMDIVMNSTRGRTEWFTSESNDPPLLHLFFQ